MNQEVLEEINQRLGVVIALLAQHFTSEGGKPSLKEQIKTLDNYGLRPAEIARLLNKTPNHINKELVSIRRSKQK